MGIRDIAYLCEFIVISNAIYVLALKDRIALYKIINLMLFFVCLQAITVIIFRFNESLELAVILSPVSKFTMGMNTLQGLLDGARNNFYDPVKSGDCCSSMPMRQPVTSVSLRLWHGVSIKFQRRK